MSRGAKKSVFLCFCGIFLFSGLAAFPPPLGAQAIERGNLVGQILDRDGRTPIGGAVLRLRNISSGAIYESAATNAQGRFRIDGLGKGIYTYGITTSQGDFNSNELIGILANETTKISISLNPYESNVQSAVQEVLREQSANPERESRIGYVLTYEPAAKRAEIFVERGLIQVRDGVRFNGPATNFSQDVDSLVVGQDRVRRAAAGQNVWLATTKPVEAGDIVYVICKKGITPFFLTPCGIAWIIAGSGAILTEIIDFKEKECVSPYKPSTSVIR
jgi:Carboxypeptidase regulatory-like domain